MALLGSRLRRGRAISATGIAALCVAIAILLLVFVPRDNAWVEAARERSIAILTPAWEVAAVPFNAMRGWQDDFTRLLSAHEENQSLRAANKQLQNRLAEVDMLRVELQKYKDLLAMPYRGENKMVAARVVADLNSPFVHTLVANVGAGAGVARGQAVIGARGLVGRVLSASESAARILLLTDFNSHIPVVTRSGNTRAILSGRNRTDPVLAFLPRQAPLADGDQLITSGDGGQIPAGIAVGTVSIDASDDVSGGGSPRIILHEDLAHIDYVRIVITPPEVTGLE